MLSPSKLKTEIALMLIDHNRYYVIYVFLFYVLMSMIVLYTTCIVLGIIYKKEQIKKEIQGKNEQN